jgi:branched-chain amino acid transport system permease protein
MGLTMNIANQMVLYSMFAVSLNVLMGFAGQASIAHAAFGAVGGYTAAVLAIDHGWSFPAAVAAGFLLTGAVGLVVSLPALRLPSEYVILLTLAFAYIIASVVIGIDALGGQYGLQGLGEMSLFGRAFTSPKAAFIPLVVAGVLVFLACWRLGESSFGRVLRGIREDEMATKALGKNTVRFKVFTFGATSAIAGLAGGLFVYYYQQVSPQQWTLNQAIAMIAMVVLGGTGNLLGSVLGAVVITASTPILENTVDLDPTKATFAQMIIYGSALVLFMMFRPEGILRERHHGTTSSKTWPWRRAPEPATAGVPVGVGADVNVDWESRLSGVSTRQAHRPAGDGVTALKVRGLVKHFGGIRAVNGVDLDLPLGKVTALIGPNGAGKSTLFGLFTGFIPADQGTIEYRGQDLRGLRPDQIANLGVVRSFQDTRLFRQMTALENVMAAVPDQAGESLLKLYFLPWKVTATNRRAKTVAMDSLRLVGMDKFANTLCADLAHGEQKLVAIARALATEAEVLLLDEPTSGIDEQWANHVADTIKRLPEIGKTVCIVEHNLAFLERLEVECYFLETGVVRTKGTLRELMSNEDLRKAYFSV